MLHLSACTCAGEEGVAIDGVRLPVAVEAHSHHPAAQAAPMMKSLRAPCRLLLPHRITSGSPPRRLPWACACARWLLGASPQLPSCSGRSLLTTHAGPCGPHAALDMHDCESCLSSCQQGIGVPKTQTMVRQHIHQPIVVSKHPSSIGSTIKALHTCQQQGSTGCDCDQAVS